MFRILCGSFMLRLLSEHVVFLLNYVWHVSDQMKEAVCDMYAILAVCITRVYECLLRHTYVCFCFVSIVPPLKL